MVVFVFPFMLLLLLILFTCLILGPEKLTSNHLIFLDGEMGGQGDQMT